LTFGPASADAGSVQIQPPGRRAAQATAVLVVVAGALVLVTSLAFVSGLVLGDPPVGLQGFVPFLAMGVLGVLLLVLGRKLRAWGSRD
jgi:protein-S-isoprenylcysteine O-methyltransferase Ste14